jgi:hypothetical protein
MFTSASAVLLAVSFAAIHLWTAPSPAASTQCDRVAYRTTTVREGSLSVRVLLGPCITDDVARTIFRAIKNGELRNRLDESIAEPAFRTFPVITPSKLAAIEVARRDELDVPGGQLRHQFTVSMSEAPQNLSGTRLFVRIQDKQVELVGYSFWLE